MKILKNKIHIVLLTFFLILLAHYSWALPKCSTYGIKHNCYGKSAPLLESEIHPYTRFYEGEWKNVKYHGHGKYQTANKEYSYEGGFKNGLHHGQGTSITPKWKYVGQWYNGQWEGQGTITYTRDQGYGV